MAAKVFFRKSADAFGENSIDLAIFATVWSAILLVTLNLCVGSCCFLSAILLDSVSSW